MGHCCKGKGPEEREEAALRLYRINKVSALGGNVVKKKDLLARSDREALDRARESPDCPVCEVLRDGQPIGVVL